MLFKLKICVCCVFLWSVTLFAGTPEDSLGFAELLSANYFEELDCDARFSLQFRLRERSDYKGNCHIERGPFSFYLRSSGEQGDPQTTAGLACASQRWHAGIGRGRPHIARGMILGNTMMGFSADPRSNYRMSSNRIGIRNYSYYPSLLYLGGTIRGISLTAMCIDRVPVLLQGLERNNFSSGIALFLGRPGILESWCEYRAASWRASLDISFTRQGWNHACADLFFHCGALQLHAGSLACAGNFTGFKSDAGWGVSPQAFSRGFCGGISFSAEQWKFKGSAYRIAEPENLRRRLYLDLQYRNKRLNAGLGLQVKNICSIAASDIFPFPRTLHCMRDILLKAGIKYTLSTALQIDIQLLTDLLHRQAGAASLRLSYRKDRDILRLQITRGASAETVIYLLRPLDTNSYSIQRMPLTESVYVDLVYARMLGPLHCSILVNASGLMFKMTMKT
ncbi:MAG: hypothetical protein PHC77_05000 [Candidatus Marinimicrobia bacterium]|jgi:hypothetical protein|nr:hypothetical protein [Candidatus Neomarinimicrobiota bacterium]MDX9777185.1 hypothetical protein [bacterium]